MSSIGGGGRRVGGPQGPVVPTPEVPKKDPAAEAQRQPPNAPKDGFEQRGNLPQGSKRGPEMPPTQAPPPRSAEGEVRFNDMLQKARHDPKALASLLNVLNQAHSKYAGEFSVERAKTETLLDKLSEQKFSKAAVDAMRGELNVQREKAAAARQRMSTQRRRMRALKQLAGRVSDPKILSELAALESEVESLQTAWAQTYVGLGLGRMLYGERDEDAPPHLRNVVKASMQGMRRGLGEAEEVGELVGDIHPGRLASRMAARQITGEPKRVSEEVLERVRGEAAQKGGRSVAAFAALYELFEGGPVSSVPGKAPTQKDEE